MCGHICITGIQYKLVVVTKIWVWCRMKNVDAGFNKIR